MRVHRSVRRVVGQPDDDDGDVVLGSVHQPRDEVLADPRGVDGGDAGREVLQGDQPLTQGPIPPLDEAVRVEDEHVAGEQVVPGGRARTTTETDHRSARLVEQRRVAVAHEHHREVPGTRVLQVPGPAVVREGHQHHARGAGDRHPVDDLVDPLEDQPRCRELVGERPHDGPELTHRGRGLDVVADDVPDHDRDDVRRDLHDVVPVATDLGVVRVRRVVGPHVDPIDLGLLRQHRALEGLGDGVLTRVQADVVDSEADPPHGQVEHVESARREPAGVSPRPRDHREQPEDAAATLEREQHDGRDPPVRQDLPQVTGEPGRRGTIRVRRGQVEIDRLLGRTVEERLDGVRPVRCALVPGPRGAVAVPPTTPARRRVDVDARGGVQATVVEEEPRPLDDAAGELVGDRLQGLGVVEIHEEA
ncbi:hypothetical protein GALL_393760 [mine drainage metagenome]|uniref:Uncharacterized protein n=1 Tax=mine drainage metagenome TaxID=410659 RepID=A0A1J5QN44_9ZZZZ